MKKYGIHIRGADPYMGFMITTDGIPGSTQIPNEILLNYIWKANGEHVKIYLYLLMACQNPGLTGQVSVETLADRLELTERDIVRALHYWEREGLLSLIENGDSIEGISLRSPDMTPPPVDTTHNFIETSAPHLKVLAREEIPERIEYTPMQIEALAKDNEVKTTLANAEQALNAPLTPAHLQLIMYMICDLGFNSELITYLYEMGASKNKTNPRYLETIAINWSKKGIRDVQAAKNETAEFNGKYRVIQTALGIHRDFAPVEREIIDGWDIFGFSDEILVEACKRTVLQSGDTNLNYVSKILSGWHDKGVKSITDIEHVDEAFHKTQKAKAKPPVRRRQHSNSFQNFHGRDYSAEDYEDMELQFLQQRKGTQ